jgi:hypothetical protein
MVYVKKDENDPGHALGADPADQQKFILCRTQIDGKLVSSVHCGKE